jgi:predicted Zn-dependent peptidase
MGVSFTSRLFKEIREKRGLCYQIRSTADNWKDVGYWSIYAGVATAKVTETVEAVMHELTKVVTSGVTNAEVTVAKKRLKTMLAFRSEDPEFLNEFYGRQELFGQKLITLDEYTAKIEAITKKDIDILLPRYIRQETLNLAVVWNKPKDEKLFTLLHF